MDSVLWVPGMTPELQSKCEKGWIHREQVSIDHKYVSGPILPCALPARLNGVSCHLYRLGKLNAREYIVRQMIGSHPRIEKCLGAVNMGGMDAEGVMIADRKGVADREIWLLLEKYTERLDDYICTPVDRTNQGNWNLVIQVAEAMQYLHAHDLVHRNLCILNTFVVHDSDGNHSIILGGLHQTSPILYGKASLPFLSRSGPIGWYYAASSDGGQFNFRIAAPEMLRNTDKSSKASDMWAFGILIYQMFTRGRTPYAHLSDLDSILRFLNQDNRLTLPYDSLTELDTLLQECWEYYPENRPVFDTAFITRLRAMEPAIEEYWKHPPPPRQTLPPLVETPITDSNFGPIAPNTPLHVNPAPNPNKDSSTCLLF